MSQQNLLGVGFDVNALSAEAQQVLQIVEKLYAELKKYDGMKISPISAGGVSELVAAAKSQQTSIEKLNKTISDLALATRTYNQVANETASINAKIAVSSSDAAKANAAAKVQLQENNKELMNNARAANDSYQLRKGIEAEEKVNNASALAEKKRIDDEKAASDREYTRTWNRLLKERDATQRKADADRIRAARAEERRLEQEGKNALKNNDLYAQLKLKQKDLETRVANASINKLSPKIQKGLVEELNAVNVAIGRVDKTLEKAGSGGAAAQFGRTLNGIMGPVRQLAYILPGLGIAGIFNLIFDAIGSVIESMGLFDKESERIVEHNKKVAESAKQTAEAMNDLADAFSEAEKKYVDYLKHQQELGAASGENFAQQIDDVDKVLEAEKILADERVRNLKVQESQVQSLNSQVIKQERGVIGMQVTLKGLRDSLLESQAAQVKIDAVAGKGVGVQLLEKAAKVNFYKDQIEAQEKLLEAENKRLDTTKYLYKQGADALKSQTDANEAIETEGAKRQKYFSDQSRAITLSNALFAATKIKEANEAIVNDDKKTTEERIEALKNVSNANTAIARARLNFVTTNANAENAAIVEANNEYNQALVVNKNNTDEKITKMTLDFYLKRLEINHKQQQTELLQEQLLDKTLMDNEQETYSKRLGALMEYTNDREQIVYNQYMKEVDIAQKTLPADLIDEKLKELFAEYMKQITDIENGVRKEAYDISQSWFAKQEKLIKEQTENSEVNAQTAATQELTDLNKSFADKEISYRKFAKAREALEYETSVKIKEAKIRDDKEELEKLEGLSKEAQSNLGRVFWLYLMQEPIMKQRLHKVKLMLQKNKLQKLAKLLQIKLVK